MTEVLTDRLEMDPAQAVEQIAQTMRRQTVEVLRRRGLVVAMSGGVDSSVCAALAIRAMGAPHVHALFMPERDSDPESLDLARGWAEQLGVGWTLEDITPILDACGCYARRDAAIREVVPEFRSDWKCKVVLPRDRLERGSISISSLVVRSPDGESRTVRLTAGAYRQIVAATSFKQRTRKMLEYYHADRLNFAVLGTPNRLEYDQGFFVKGGDGLADLKPIAHLYKSQVYQLAEYLGIPEHVVRRRPTTDTYSLPQDQDEFYFALPPLQMDVALLCFNAGDPPDVAAEALGVEPILIERVYRDIEQKRATTRYLHLSPLLVEDPLPAAGDA